VIILSILMGKDLSVIGRCHLIGSARLGKHTDENQELVRFQIWVYWVCHRSQYCSLIVPRELQWNVILISMKTLTIIYCRDALLTASVIWKYLDNNVFCFYFIARCHRVRWVDPAFHSQIWFVFRWLYFLLFKSVSPSQPWIQSD
jgi:hypothetical protein